MKQARAKQGVGANGHRDSGRGRACRSGVEGMRGGAARAAASATCGRGWRGRQGTLPGLGRRQSGGGWRPEKLRGRALEKEKLQP